MKKIKIILESPDKEMEFKALSSYISLFDKLLSTLWKALRMYEEDPERAYHIIQTQFNDARNQHNSIQSKLGLNPLHETRYSQFKKQATTRRPSDAVHRAVKEVYRKIKELRKTVEYAGRMKQEMNQGNDYKKRTQEAIEKLMFELKELSSTLKKEWKPKVIKK